MLFIATMVGSPFLSALRTAQQFNLLNVVFVLVISIGILRLRGPAEATHEKRPFLR